MPITHSYLVVSLFLQQIEDSISASQSSIHSIVASLPHTLEAFYEKTLSQAHDQATLRKLLHIIVSAKSHLSLAELNIALHIDSSTTDCKSVDRNCEPSLGMESYTKNLCVSFVRIFRAYLKFARLPGPSDSKGIHRPAIYNRIHPTIGVETLTGIIRVEYSPSAKLYLLPLLCRIRSAVVKLFEKGKWKASPRLSRFLKDHTFLSYASRHWSTHYRAASLSSTHLPTSAARELRRKKDPASEHGTKSTGAPSVVPARRITRKSAAQRHLILFPY